MRPSSHFMVKMGFHVGQFYNNLSILKSLIITNFNIYIWGRNRLKLSGRENTKFLELNAFVFTTFFRKIGQFCTVPKKIDFK